MGFCLAYAIGALNVWLVLHRLIGVVSTRFNLSLAVSLFALGGLVIYLSGISSGFSLLVGSLMTAIVALFSIKKLKTLIDISE